MKRKRKNAARSDGRRGLLIYLSEEERKELNEAAQRDGFQFVTQFIRAASLGKARNIQK